MSATVIPGPWPGSGRQPKGRQKPPVLLAAEPSDDDLLRLGRALYDVMGNNDRYTIGAVLARLSASNGAEQRRSFLLTVPVFAETFRGRAGR